MNDDGSALESQETSGIDTDNEDGRSSSTDEPSSGEGSESEAAQRGLTETVEEEAGENKNGAGRGAGREVPAEKPRQRKMLRKVKRDAIHAYQKLLDANSSNSDRTDHEGDDLLRSSQIGGSHWSLREKEAFFNAIAKCGPNDIHAVAQHVRTKSSAEIHFYLRLLRKAACEEARAAPGKAHVSLKELPAAFEVTAECVDAMESMADVLAREEYDESVVNERKRYPDDWLIDEEVGERIEERFGRSRIDNRREAADGKDEPTISSLDLLRPQALLLLSRTLFMNGPPGSGYNYREIQLVDDVKGPAIFHSALDELHALVVGLTRRLVQASLFQAMSRLRAFDASRANRSPAADVKDVDVRTAAEIIGLSIEWKTYWATLPRRSGIEVRTQQRKYQDGRQNGKMGVKLTYEEVESELGLLNQAMGDNSGDDESSTLHLSDMDSDDFTELEASTPDEGAMGNSETESEHEGVEIQAARTATHSVKGTSQPAHSKRKRTLDLPDFLRAEARYLDTLDMQASYLEERRIYESLKLTPPATLQSPGILPDEPVLKISSGAVPHARQNTNLHVLRWSAFDGNATATEFVEVAARGERGKNKRMRLQEQLIAAAGQHVVEGIGSGSGRRSKRVSTLPNRQARPTHQSELPREPRDSDSEYSIVY